VRKSNKKTKKISARRGTGSGSPGRGRGLERGTKRDTDRSEEIKETEKSCQTCVTERWGLKKKKKKKGENKLGIAKRASGGLRKDLRRRELGQAKGPRERPFACSRQKAVCRGGVSATGGTAVKRRGTVLTAGTRRNSISRIY